MPFVIHTVGARPNLVKMAPVIAAVGELPGYEQLIVHTGQHYDASLSDDLFGDLGLPRPDVFLGVGSAPHGEQTARALTAVERLLMERRPDLLVVAGDVNSTLAAALAASKLGIPVAHVEAGLRSGDWTMPEEVNRVLTDRLSQFLYTHSPDAEANLLAEGIEASRINYVGNTMIDSLRHHEGVARKRATWRTFGLEPERYVLVTLHRPSNVDSPARLAAIVEALARLASRHPVVFPLHPRTRQRLQREDLLQALESAGALCTEPLGYLDFLALECRAGAVLTDSGGIQEETTALGVACYTLRKNTERPITLTHGTNTLIGEDPEAILSVTPRALRPTEIPLWDGRAGWRIAAAIAAHHGVESHPAAG